jgi:hypothetical protein
MMTTTTAKQSLKIRSFIERKEAANFPITVVLALHLLEEKHAANSFWKPYIDIFPVAMPIPLFFTPKDMIGLKGTTVIRTKHHYLCRLSCLTVNKNVIRGYF